ncbi:MAG: mechanosensitive ion channel family protein [Planctomycetota bacterium]
MAFALMVASGVAQSESIEPAPPSATAAPVSVQVAPTHDDTAIERRLRDILAATGWFRDPSVQVRDGVVTLTGVVDDEAHRAWATELARKTIDVVAVINRQEVDGKPVLDVAPALRELRALARGAVHMAPLLLLAALIVALTVYVAGKTRQLARSAAERRLRNPLLSQMAANTIALPVLLGGVYIALRVCGLTQLAVTMVGGTGLLGLIVGIAFRDIAENFLASILISVQRPFRIGDVIEVGGHQGFVQHVNLRGTLLMTPDGNHVQIPNSTIYKSDIVNYTANPNVRQDFVVGVGYDVAHADVQRLILDVVRAQDAVLAEPEPLVLVDELAAAAVRLRVYFWVNGTKHSAIKVRSSVQRVVLGALLSAHISMPDEAREVVFPQGVNVRLTRDDRTHVVREAPARPPQPQPETVSAGEGDLDSNAEEIRRQADRSRRPEDGANLLRDAAQRDRA